MKAAPDGGGESADKAFWISFADLMTALMVLFLVVMAVALLSITQASASAAATATAAATAVATVTASAAAAASAAEAAAAAASAPATPGENTQAQAQAQAQSQAIDTLMQALSRAAAASPGVQVDHLRHVVDFGDRARFPTGSHQLDADSARLLRQFVPQMLAVTQSALGQRWVSRVVVEGFTDVRGDYLYNLNLSLQRAQRVLCSLLDDSDQRGDNALDDSQRAAVRKLFAVGGFSYNGQRESLDASRRIELRIEFGPGLTATPVTPQAEIQKATPGGYGSCRLGA